MKTPPFLLLAVMLFWGWESDFLLIGAVMGGLLELPRLIRFRWDLDDADFSRIWGFCSVLNLVLVVYVFTSNNQGGLTNILEAKNAVAAANASVQTATRFLQWLPMTAFAFIAAQVYNIRESVPLTGISLVLRWRRRKGDTAFSGRYLNISYPYFMVCLFAAGIHANTGTLEYFAGQLVLIGWALWSVRPKRFSWYVWLMALILTLGIGIGGIGGIMLAQRAIQNFNAQWMARLFGNRTDPLQTMTSMGRIGKLKLSAKIVIRLEPNEVGHVPEYLREASYRNYQAFKMTWYSGGSVSDFEEVRAEPDTTSFVLVPGKKTTDAVTIASYLNGYNREVDAPEGLLPLPSGCARLEKMPATVANVKKNKTGAVLVDGPGLMVFEAHYGTGLTLDSPPAISVTNHYDLNVPTNEIPAISNALVELNLPPSAGETEKRRAISKFFSDKFTYSTWQGEDKRSKAGDTPLTKFLTTSRSGHCEYFATATVLLLRQLGIPARYAVGYYVHETRGAGYVVRERDAHAWCLVWNSERNIWEDFDTTPASWVSNENKSTRLEQWMADCTSWFRYQFAKFRWRQTDWQQYVIWALIPVLLVLLWHIIFRRRGKLKASNAQKKHAAQIVWPGLDSEFYRLEKMLASAGVPRQPGETMADWLERATHSDRLAGLREPLRELLRLHYRLRFDPKGLDDAEREELKRRAVEALEKIATASG